MKGHLKGCQMPLPIKSLYNIWGAMRFIRRATGETAMPDQILDWGTQGRYRLHLLIERGYIRAIGTKRIIRVQDSIFELHLSSEQAAILGRHDEVEISECWHNGIAFNFVRPHIGNPLSWYTYRASINGFGIRLLGTELAAFTASIAEPQQTALATDTATPVSVAADSASGGVKPESGHLAVCSDWTLVKPQRFQGYRNPLYDLLKAAHIAGKPCPKARDVLEAWREKAPPEVAMMLADSLDYYDAKGGTKPLNLNAIRKAINRLTRVKRPTTGR